MMCNLYLYRKMGCKNLGPMKEKQILLVATAQEHILLQKFIPIEQRS